MGHDIQCHITQCFEWERIPKYMWLNSRLHIRHMCGGGQIWRWSLQYNRSINAHCSGFIMFCYGYVSSNLKLKSTGISHYNGVIMGIMAPQITSLAIFYSTVYSGAAQRKYQSPASLALNGEFPAKMPSNAENVSIWWRHHVIDVQCGSRLITISVKNNETS